LLKDVVAYLLKNELK